MGDADVPDLPEASSTSDARVAAQSGLAFDLVDPDLASFTDA
jgi:hypothetical protein